MHFYKAAWKIPGLNLDLENEIDTNDEMLEVEDEEILEFEEDLLSEI